MAKEHGQEIDMQLQSQDTRKDKSRRLLIEELRKTYEHIWTERKKITPKTL